MVAVDFSPRTGRGTGIRVAERRLSGSRGHEFNRRSATRLICGVLVRGLKSTASLMASLREGLTRGVETNPPEPPIDIAENNSA